MAKSCVKKEIQQIKKELLTVLEKWKSWKKSLNMFKQKDRSIEKEV